MGDYPTPNGDSLEPLIRQFKDLQRQLNDLQRPPGTSIAESIEALRVQSAEIAAQSERKLVPQVQSVGTSNFAMSTGYADKLGLSFTVPAGYSQALITVTGGLNACTSSTSGDRLYARAVIAGVAGPEMAAVITVNDPYAQTFAGHGATLTGLAAGAVIAVSIQSRLQIGPSSASIGQPYNTVSMSAQAIFRV